MVDETEASDAPHANLVFIGPCGCGKSTTAGRLIADCGAVDRQTLERISREAAEHGQEHRRFAWVLDKLQCERERGGTMHVALWRLASRRCRFTIIDAPGHNDFAKDAVTAMSQADIAVIVVSEEALEEVRERALLAYTLGLRQLVVCVNKMDAEAAAYSQEHFEGTCDRVREDLKHTGLKTHDVHFDVRFVPTSALAGDNVVCRSGNTPWYCGPTLIEALDEAVATHFMPERPLRLLLHEYMQIGGTGVVVVGRVATGSLRAGTRLLFVPGNVPAEVRTIEMHHQALEEATCGDYVNISVDVTMKDLKRGMVASVADESPAHECCAFLAQVIVLSPPRAGDIETGCVLMVECHTARVPCIFEELLSRTDRRTGQVLEMKPETLQAGDAAVVRLRPQAPMCVEAFSEYPPLGRFAVRDQKTTVAVGVVQQVDAAPLATAAKPRCKVKSQFAVKTPRHEAGSEETGPPPKPSLSSVLGGTLPKRRAKEAPAPRLRVSWRDSAGEAELCSDG